MTVKQLISRVFGGIFALLMIIAIFVPLFMNELEYERYLVYPPQDTSEAMPLLLFLHGSGSRGDDISIVENIDLPFINPDHDFPFLVVAPQCSEGKDWSPRPLVKLIDSVSAQYNVDTDRIYVTGLSMGGYGAWKLGVYAPQKFAAIAPLCGGYEGNEPSDVLVLADTPIWTFHGLLDEAVDPSKTTELMDILSPKNPQAKLTLYEELGHDVWTTVYNDPAFYDWLLAQKL